LTCKIERVEDSYFGVKKVKTLMHSKSHMGDRNDILCAVCDNCI
jgi:hypothetical protein